jgi:hypothetical protein
VIITPVTFDSHSLNSADIRTVGRNLNSPPAAKPVFLDNANEDSDYSGGFTVDVRSVALDIEILDYPNRFTVIEQLRGWFQRGAEGDLVVTLDVDGDDYLASCVVVNLIQDAQIPTRFTAMLQTGQSAWLSVNRDTDSWTATNAAKTKTITVQGTEGVLTQLNIDLLPTVAPGSGYFYQKLLQLVGTAVDYGVRPWCISVDTAALVTAGKLRSDCRDLRIFVGSTEARRWVADPNTNHTHVWFNAPLGPSWSLTLRTALDDHTDPRILEFVVDAASQAAIAAMPYQGILYHGTEWFSYQGKNAATGTLFIQKRGAFGTAWQAHLAAVVFQTIQNAIFQEYGNPAAADPAASDANYDDTKPVFNLSSSDNTAWVYDATSIFYDPAHPGRLGQWLPYDGGQNGANSKLFNFVDDAGSGSPACGMRISPYIGTNGKWWPINNGLYEWKFASKGGIASVSLAGKKIDSVYSPSGFTWPSAGFAYYSDVDPYYWLHAAFTAQPGTSWAAWTCAVSAADYPYIMIFMSGQVVGQSLGYAGLELTSGTITFTAATLPASTLLAEVVNYPLSIGIKNDTTGDQINLLFPMILNEALELDSEEKTALYHGINCHGCIFLDDESRSVWIRLQEGANALEIIGADLGTIALSLSWNRRRM